MKFNPRTLIVTVVSTVILIVMILWMAGSFEDKIEPGQNITTHEYKGDVFVVKATLVPQFEQIAGTLQSMQSSVISSRIMARVVNIHVHAGDSVSKGDLLIELDSADLKSRVKQARQQLKGAQAQQVQAQSHYRRIQQLFNKHSATQAELEQATSGFHSARSAANVAREALAEAENALSFSRITATFNGRVTDHYIDNGDMVAPGMRLLTVYDPSALQVDAFVRESLALTLQPGQTLKARVDAIQKDLPAVVSEMVAASEPGSRSFLVKSVIEHDARLLPGMFVRLSIPLDMAERILVPEHYVRQVGQLDVVWVEENGQLQRRFVRIGKTTSTNKVEIITGLQTGEHLVLPQVAFEGGW